MNTKFDLEDFSCPSLMRTDLVYWDAGEKDKIARIECLVALPVNVAGQQFSIQHYDWLQFGGDWNLCPETIKNDDSRTPKIYTLTEAIERLTIEQRFAAERGTNSSIPPKVVEALNAIPHMDDALPQYGLIRSDSGTLLQLINGVPFGDGIISEDVLHRAQMHKSAYRPPLNRLVSRKPVQKEEPISPIEKAYRCVSKFFAHVFGLSEQAPEPITGKKPRQTSWTVNENNVATVLSKYEQAGTTTDASPDRPRTTKHKPPSENPWLNN